MRYGCRRGSDHIVSAIASIFSPIMSYCSTTIENVPVILLVALFPFPLVANAYRCVFDIILEILHFAFIRTNLYILLFYILAFGVWIRTAELLVGMLLLERFTFF